MVNFAWDDRSIKLENVPAGAGSNGDISDEVVAVKEQNCDIFEKLKKGKEEEEGILGNLGKWGYRNPDGVYVSPAQPINYNRISPAH